MAKLNFRGKQLAAMLRHANANKRKIPYENKHTEKKGLWLVKDDGIYLMSPTSEKFIAKKNDINTVVYASGYKPTKANADTLWDKTHRVSGDDFVEFIELAPSQVRNVLKGGSISISLTETEIGVSA